MKDKNFLSRATAERLLRAADTIERMQGIARANSSQNTRGPISTEYLARLTAEIVPAEGEDPNEAGKVWAAEQVYIDSLGAVVALVGGMTWDETNPLFTVAAATALDVLTVTQKARPKIDESTPACQYWTGGAAGGGGGGSFISYVKIKSKIDQKNYTADVYAFPGDTNPPTAIDVPVYFHNVNYGEIALTRTFQAQLVGALYYAYAPTWGG